MQTLETEICSRFSDLEKKVNEYQQYSPRESAHTGKKNI